MPKAKNHRKATYLQTLYEYDGPKLILLKTPGVTYILAVAIVNEKFEEPFFGVEVTHEQLSELAYEDFSVRYLFLKPKYKTRFFIDLEDLDWGDQINLIPVAKNIEVSQYLPGRTFFASDFTEEIRLADEAVNRSEERILVDGNWEISDFSDLYGGYSDLYSFTDGISKFSDNDTSADVKRTILRAFEKQWQGGGSYGSFYRSMRGAQTPGERLGLGGFEYHSPGFVDLEGKGELLDAVTVMLKDFDDASVQISAGYKDLYKYLQNNKLLSMPADKFDKSTAIAKSIANRAKEFCEILPGAKWDTLLTLAHGHQLVAAKVCLSLFRRLDRLNDFQLQGRVTFGKAQAAAAPVVAVTD